MTQVVFTFLIFTDEEAEEEITLTKVTQLVGISGT